MKKILIFIFLISITAACNPIAECTYTIEVVYTNGDQEVFTTTNRYSKLAGVEPHLYKGELRTWDGSLRSGVRSFKIVK
jgi:hypothetical protein